MRAANFMQSELQVMGYDTPIHRYWISDFSYAVNVCGYKEGTTFPDEWLVLGAHLDIAESEVTWPVGPDCVRIEVVRQSDS
jgi:hypothetical protein